MDVEFMHSMVWPHGNLSKFKPGGDDEDKVIRRNLKYKIEQQLRRIMQYYSMSSDNISAKSAEYEQEQYTVLKTEFEKHDKRHNTAELMGLMETLTSRVSDFQTAYIQQNLKHKIKKQLKSIQEKLSVSGGGLSGQSAQDVQNEYNALEKEFENHDKKHISKELTDLLKTLSGRVSEFTTKRRPKSSKEGRFAMHQRQKESMLKAETNLHESNNVKTSPSGRQERPLRVAGDDTSHQRRESVSVDERTRLRRRRVNSRNTRRQARVHSVKTPRSPRSDFDKGGERKSPANAESVQGTTLCRGDVHQSETSGNKGAKTYKPRSSQTVAQVKAGREERMERRLMEIKK
eukprot:3080900-Rhodomonas_salina.2